jgi:hypothetical protein
MIIGPDRFAALVIIDRLEPELETVLISRSNFRSKYSRWIGILLLVGSAFSASSPSWRMSRLMVQLLLLWMQLRPRWILPRYTSRRKLEEAQYLDEAF